MSLALREDPPVTIAAFVDAQGFDKPRPDLLVQCGPGLGRNFVTDPLVVVAVLSPSTMDNDRGEKLRF